MADIMRFSPLWGEWHIKEEIRQEAYGSVYRAEKYGGGKTCVSAVKHISLPSENVAAGASKEYCDTLKDKLINEFNLYSALSGHDNIVSYEDQCVIPKDGGIGYDIFVRMELLPNMLQYQQKNIVTEREAIRFGINLCDALALMKEKGIVHGDIKPANIFATENGVFKLGNFIGASLLSGGASNPYASPEVAHGAQADILSEIYSVGLIIYRMLNGDKAPFISPDAEITPTMIEAANARRLNGETLPRPRNCRNAPLANAVLKACAFDPRARWQTPQEMKRAIIPAPSVILEKSVPASETEAATVLPHKAANHQPPVNQYQRPPQSPVNQPQRPQPPEAPKKKNGLAVVIIAICALIAVAGVAAAAILPKIFAPSEETDPSVSDTVGEDPTDPEPPATEQTPTEPEPTETDPVTITLGSYTDMTYDRAKAMLEEQGIVVSYKGVPNFDIERNTVIGQSPAEGAKLTAGSVVELTVSKGPYFDEVPATCEQLLYVESSGQNATMTLYNYNSAEDYWDDVFTCSATVGINGVGYDYGEGKKITPQGVFKLGTVLAASKPSTNMPYTAVTSSTCVVEDVNSDLYNRIMDINSLPPNTDYDAIGQRLVNGAQNAAIFIEHNGDGFSSANVVKGKASSITICGRTSDFGATNGCIDISSGNMTRLLAQLDGDKNPYIKVE